MKERISNVPVTTATQDIHASKRDYIAGLSLTELETIALEVLSEALQTINPASDPELAMKLANATLDRSRGKPGQAITMDATLRTITVNAMISFADEIQPMREISTITIENNNIDNPEK